MLYKHLDLDQLVKQVRSFGEYLMPFNFPQRHPHDEEEISCLKSREVTIDGYSLILFYSKADYNTYYLEVLQVTGKYFIFLPFFLVCKIGKIFLGDQHLYYIDFFRDGRKIYCWTVFRDKTGKAIEVPHNEDKVLDNVFEGFNYKCLKFSNIRFY